MNALSEKKPGAGPKDVFLHLFSVILLYFSAINVGVLLYQIINIFFPDLLTDYVPDPSMYRGPLRWALATLMVVFPVYVWSVWYLNREYIRDSGKRELKTRKWLLTFTLFVAALVIVGDAVAVLFRFLDGELTTRFALKVITILAISSSVFTYYFWALKPIEFTRPSWIRWFPKTVIALLAVFVAVGFFQAGSPASERLRKFDQRRIADLQSIQSQIIYHWQKKDALPSSLEALTDTISGYKSPRDPQSGNPYEYTVKEDLVFELCAQFEAEGQSEATMPVQYRKGPEPIPVGKEPYMENWNHAVGKTCFTRTIDPELYRETKDKPSGSS